MPRIKDIPAVEARQVEEAVHAYTWDLGNGTVTLAVGYRENGQFPSQSYETIRLAGQDYDDLLAADGGGEVPGKPAGTFRTEDLWPFVDRVRAKPQRGDTL